MDRPNKPVFKSIRETAKTGILPESLLRQMQKQGKLPGIKSGVKFLVNYTMLLEILNDRTSEIYQEVK